MTWITVPDRPYAATPVYLPQSVLEGVEHVRGAVKGCPLTVVRHDYAAWRQLRERGLIIPAPTCRYHWPGPFTPMSHQTVTVDKLIEHDKVFCLNGLRTGKTNSAIWAADYLRREGAIRRVLVVAPLFICDIVWERALFQSVPDATAVVLKGTRHRKQLIASDTRFDWIIVNPESLHLIVDCLKDVDLIIIDEFTRFKNVRSGGKKSRRYAALQEAAQGRRLWLLSGTPAPQSPLDAYGPIRLVNPRRLSFTQWRDMTMTRITEFKWVPRPGAAETVAQWMQPAVRFRREDCIDIPDMETATLEVSLSAQQRKLIQEFVDTAAAQVAAGVHISAVNAAAVGTKILQVMAGGVYGEDPEGERVTHRVDAGPYLEAVESVVREAACPVIVFANFQCSVDVTADHLDKQGFRVGRLTRGRAVMTGRGRVKSMELFDAFQRGELDALIAIPSTMQFGLELTASHVVLWASPPHSYEQYDQGTARVTGSSQKNKVMVLHLVQSPVTRELFHRLKSKEMLQNTVLDLIEGRITV